MPLSGEEMQGLAQLAKTTVKQMLNPKSQAFKKLKPDLEAMDEQEVIQLIASEPRILKRPVLSDGRRMVSGFSEPAFEAMLS